MVSTLIQLLFLFTGFCSVSIMRKILFYKRSKKKQKKLMCTPQETVSLFYQVGMGIGYKSKSLVVAYVLNMNCGLLTLFPFKGTHETDS